MGCPYYRVKIEDDDAVEICYRKDDNEKGYGHCYCCGDELACTLIFDGERWVEEPKKELRGCGGDGKSQAKKGNTG